MNTTRNHPRAAADTLPKTQPQHNPNQTKKERRLLQVRLQRVQDVLVAQHSRFLQAHGQVRRGRQDVRHHEREQQQGPPRQRDPLQVPHPSGLAGVPEPGVHHGRRGGEFVFLDP